LAVCLNACADTRALLVLETLSFIFDKVRFHAPFGWGHGFLKKKIVKRYITNILIENNPDKKDEF